MNKTKRFIFEYLLLSVLLLSARCAKISEEDCLVLGCKWLPTVSRPNANNESEDYCPLSLFELLSEKKFAGKGSNGVVYTGRHNKDEMAVKLVTNDDSALS